MLIKSYLALYICLKKIIGKTKLYPSWITLPTIEAHLQRVFIKYTSATVHAQNGMIRMKKYKGRITVTTNTSK